MKVLVAAILLICPPAFADGEPAGDFDYYVLSLSWTPSWCAEEGDRRDAAQCDAGRGFGFSLHGLWPQYETGWPAYCRTAAEAPSRAETAAMADIMGSGGLAWHQWRKHGVCTGLSSEAYFDLARQAYGAVTRPEVLRRITGTLRIDPAVIESAFLEANTGMEPDQITITCKSGRIQEARICLTRDLGLRDCGPDVLRDCTIPRAEISGIR